MSTVAQRFASDIKLALQRVRSVAIALTGERHNFAGPRQPTVRPRCASRVPASFKVHRLILTFFQRAFATAILRARRRDASVVGLISSSSAAPPRP
jgi:hypothetical protein